MPGVPLARGWPTAPELRNASYVDIPYGNVDVFKARPLLFDMNTVKYRSLGPSVAGCWNVGQQMKK